MKTLFITAYNTFISRNLFNTDVLKIIKSDKNLRIVIFCPPNKKELLEKYYGDSNIVFEGLDMEPVIKTSWNKKLYRLSFLLENSHYVKDQRLERLEKNKNVLGYVNYLWINSLATILSSTPLFHKAYRVFDFYFSDRRVLKPYFDKYNPDFLFVADVFGETDIWFLKEGRSRNIPTLGMVRSWDNTTTKGILRIIPDRLIVNSPTVKRELEGIHHCEEKNIYVAGLPQFDSWLSGPTMSRDEFFKRIGADINKKLILFAPAGYNLSDTDWQLCEILNEAIANNKFAVPVQILIRNHPQHPAFSLVRFKDNPNFIIENPGWVASKTDFKNAELVPGENDHLRNSIYYSEMVMYIATSLGLDASIFNKPQIMISFDGWESRPYIKSVRRYNTEDCLFNLVRCGGTKVVFNKEEWIEAMNDYLVTPSLDQEGRNMTIEQHLYKIDGKAGERTANFILSFLRDKN